MDKDPSIPPEVKDRVDAVEGIITAIDKLSIGDKLSVLMVSSAKVVDQIVADKGHRGKIINAAKEDFARILQKHVRFL